MKTPRERRAVIQRLRLNAKEIRRLAAAGVMHFDFEDAFDALNEADFLDTAAQELETLERESLIA